MKLTRKVLALVLALVMVMGLAATASAASVNNHTNHDYRVYQIFTGDQDASSPVLSNIKWGSSVDTTKTIDGHTLMDTINATYGKSFETVTDVAKFLAEDPDPTNKASDASKFAEILVPYLKPDAYVAIINAGDTEVEVVNGYYLLVDCTLESDLQYLRDQNGEFIRDDKGEKIPTTDARNLALLQVTKRGDINISKKYDVPHIDKSIRIQRGETFEQVNVGDYAYGDTVNFDLTAHLPSDLRGYYSYKMVFHDQMSAGLELDTNSFTVTLDGTTVIPKAVEDDPATTDVDETVVGWSLSNVTDTTFELIIEDAVHFGAKENSIVVVNYDATVTPDAKMSSEGCEENEFWLEFSNSPNWYPSEERPEPPTGITPKDKVKVYVTGVKITKKDSNTGNRLQGAEFELTGTKTNIVKITRDTFEQYTDTNYDTNNMYWELNDGTYTSTNPSTPNLDTTKYVDTSVVYKMVTTDEFVETQENEDAKAFVDEQGELIFRGLSAGTYTITETTTPVGYNSIAPITLTITFNADTETFSYKWEGIAGGSSDSYEITVWNDQGSVLPETGGMGTTLFYVLGTMMVLGSAVLLITKKRMTAE